jgi:hypothetical protein
VKGIDVAQPIWLSGLKQSKNAFLVFLACFRPYILADLKNSVFGVGQFGFFLCHPHENQSEFIG